MLPGVRVDELKNSLDEVSLPKSFAKIGTTCSETIV